MTSVAVATPLGEDLDGDGFDDDTGEPVDPDSGDGDGDGDGDDGDDPIDPQPPVNKPGFYYLSSEPVTKTFTKLAKPSINLTKVILDEGLETEKEVNAIKWAPIPSATKYDVYVSVTTTEVIPDNPETPDVNEYEEITTTTLEIFRVEDYPELFGTIVDTGEHYFTLQDITYETYDIYIRAVGDDVAYISSTRSESIQIHIPLAPKNFKYNQQTGEITWTNTTPASHIVLGISTLNTNNMEFENETFVELNPGTTSYQLGEINEYQVRIKARLKFDNANSYDSDYSDTVLRIEFNLFASGNGTTVPYGIETEEHLNNIRYFTTSNFVLKNDIVLDSYANWIIVGSADKPFTGQINGSTYTISGFNYTDSTTNIALVYSLGSESNSSASIKNLGLDINVDSKYVVRVQNFAGVAINNYGTIENIDISGNVNISCTTSPANLYGGAVATNYGTINNVVNTMSIIASRGISDSTQFTMVGGVAAINEGTITRSGNSGTLKGQYVGGIVADNFNTITYSYNKGSIEALSDGFNMSVYAGGIAARNDKLTPLSDDCIIANCYAIFDSVVGSTLVVNNSGSNNAYAGGIAGQTIDGVALIKNCYAIVNTFSSTNTGEAKAGSLVANVTTTASAGYYMVLKNTYACSNVTIFIANSNNANINTGNVSTLGTYIRAVASLEDSKTTVGSNIDGITINDISLLPRLSWEPV